MTKGTPRIVRRLSVPVRKGQHYRSASVVEALRRDFNNRCAYCMTHEVHAGGERAMEIDHFHANGDNSYENLLWSCKVCNNGKRDRPNAEERARGLRLINPCEETDYGVYFFQNDTGRLELIEDEGAFHLDLLCLNRDLLVYWRQVAQERRQLHQDAKLRRAGLQDDDEQSELLDRMIDCLERDIATMIPLIKRETRVSARKRPATAT